MTRHPLPAEILNKHIAILGKTGSGKTYTAKGVVEGLLDAKQPTCIIDPTGVWWGLRLKADGKTPAYPVVVFGGRRADVEIKAGHGTAIGNLIASGAVPASIIDTSLFSVADYTRFMIDFTDALFRGLKGILNLVIDEAHKFAPKGKVPSPQAGQMLHNVNNLVSGGRSGGFRIMLLTQRPAKLHNDSLTQVDTLIAMRLMAPHDKAAVKDWISDNTAGEQLNDVMGSLAGLKPGEGWVWCPELGPAYRVTFPRIKTFDSSATPTTKGKPLATLAPVNLSVVRSQLAEIEEEVRANDPTKLKAEIVALKAQLAKTPATNAPVKAAPGPEAIAKATQRGHQQGYAAGWHDRGEAFLAPFREIGRQLTEIGKTVATELAKAKIAKPNAAAIAATAPLPIFGTTPVGLAYKRETAGAEKPSSDFAKVSRQASNTTPTGGDALPQGEHKILLAIVQQTDADGVGRDQLTALTGYKRATRNTYIQRLGARGLVEERNGGLYATEAGVAALGPDYERLPTGRDLQDWWLQRLPEGESKILKLLLDRDGQAVSRDEISASTGYKRATRNTYLQRLGAKRLVDVTGDGVAASRILFD